MRPGIAEVIISQIFILQFLKSVNQLQHDISSLLEREYQQNVNTFSSVTEHQIGQDRELKKRKYVCYKKLNLIYRLLSFSANIYLLLYKSKIPFDCVLHIRDELSCENCSPICDINMPSLVCNTASEGLDFYLLSSAVTGESCGDFSRDLAFSFSKALIIVVVTILTQAFSNQFNVTLSMRSYLNSVCPGSFSLFLPVYFSP